MPDNTTTGSSRSSPRIIKDARRSYQGHQATLPGITFPLPYRDTAALDGRYERHQRRLVRVRQCGHVAGAVVHLLVHTTIISTKSGPPPVGERESTFPSSLRVEITWKTAVCSKTKCAGRRKSLHKNNPKATDRDQARAKPKLGCSPLAFQLARCWWTLMQGTNKRRA